MLTLLLCLTPACAGAQARVPVPDMRALAWHDREVIAGGDAATVVTELQAFLRFTGDTGFRYRAGHSEAPLSPQLRAMREVQAILARKPRIFIMRPLVSLTFTAEAQTLGGIAPVMLGAVPSRMTLMNHLDEEWRRGWDSNPR